MVRGTLLSLAGSEAVKNAVTSAPGIGDIVTRFAAGESDDDAMRATSDLREAGFEVTLDYLGEDTLDRAAGGPDHGRLRADPRQARRCRARPRAPRSPSSSPRLARLCSDDGDEISTDNARAICEAAAEAGTTVTLDMEDHTTTDLTLSTLSCSAGRLPVHRCSPAGLSASNRR